MKLVAEIREENLLFKLMHQLGATFYRLVGEGVFEVVYFSGEKIVHYIGKMNEEHAKLLPEMAWMVKEILLDEVQGEVKIKQ